MVINIVKFGQLTRLISLVLSKFRNISSDSATPVNFNIITIKLTGVELSNK